MPKIDLMKARNSSPFDDTPPRGQQTRDGNLRRVQRQYRCTSLAHTDLSNPAVLGPVERTIFQLKRYCRPSPCLRLAQGRSESGNRMRSITAKRMISGDALKYWKGERQDMAEASRRRGPMRPHATAPDDHTI